MKNIIKTKFILVSATVLLIIGSCSDDFLDRPIEDGFAASSFFKTEDQVESSTNALYLRPWYQYVSEAAWPIAEIGSGNARTFDARNSAFGNFSVNSGNNTLNKAWESLFAVIAQSNSVINVLPEEVSADVPVAVVNNALGEARFMRGIAYFYLMRIFGSVPLIEDNRELIIESNIPRHRVEDIYEFIKRDFEFAEVNLYSKIRGSNFDANARVSSGSATAFLAKISLYQKDYSTAYALADEVIRSGEFKLYGGDAEDGDSSGSYRGLFITANDNNPESIFSLQWTNTGQFAEGNGVQSFYAPSGVTGFADGWSALGPSLDLQDAYEDKVEDLRYAATVMDPESFYPEINGGYTAPASINFQNTNVGIKKYVIGSGDGGGQQSYPNNTYMMRYAELLLIHAEAALNGGGPVSAGTVSLNKVRRRAGLQNIDNPTLDDIFHERRIELALECEFWYDVVRLGTNQAITYLSDVEKGFFSDNTISATVNSQKFTPNADDLLLPYPATETTNNPALLEDPVPYDFN